MTASLVSTPYGRLAGATTRAGERDERLTEPDRDARAADLLAALARRRLARDHATARFDEELAAAEAAGTHRRPTARTLRWWQRESLRGVGDHLQSVLPGLLAALEDAERDAAEAVAASAESWAAATGAAAPAARPRRTTADPIGRRRTAAGRRRWHRPRRHHGPLPRPVDRASRRRAVGRAARACSDARVRAHRSSPTTDLRHPAVSTPPPTAARHRTVCSSAGLPSWQTALTRRQHRPPHQHPRDDAPGPPDDRPARHQDRPGTPPDSGGLMTALRLLPEFEEPPARDPRDPCGQRASPAPTPDPTEVHVLAGRASRPSRSSATSSPSRWRSSTSTSTTASSASCRSPTRRRRGRRHRRPSATDSAPSDADSRDPPGAHQHHA